MHRRLAAATALAACLPLAAAAAQGEAGDLRILYWQAATHLNPYLSPSGKDSEPAGLVLEPLAMLDPDGVLVPRLAEAVPTLENGGVSADRTSITWTLKPDLKWSDGTPMTARDAVFTANYCMAEGSGCAPAARFEGVTAIEALDDRRVKITFDAPRGDLTAPS